MSWLKIIGILLVVALIGGLVFGLLGEMIGLSPSMKLGGVGALVGLTAAALLSRKNAFGNQQNKP